MGVDECKQHGKDGLFAEFAAFVIPKSGIGKEAVVLVDLDDNSLDQLGKWFKDKLAYEIRKTSKELSVEDGPAKGRVKSFRIAPGKKPGQVALVGVGCPDHVELKDIYQVKRFAIDDWVLRLALNQGVYDAVDDFKEKRPVTFENAKHKFVGVRDLFRENKLDISKSKAYLHILGALTEIGPKSATIIERLVKKGYETLHADGLREFMKPFFDDLFDADSLLRPLLPGTTP